MRHFRLGWCLSIARSWENSSGQSSDGQMMNFALGWLFGEAGGVGLFFFSCCRFFFLAGLCSWNSSSGSVSVLTGCLGFWVVGGRRGAVVVAFVWRLCCDPGCWSLDVVGLMVVRAGGWRFVSMVGGGGGSSIGAGSSNRAGVVLGEGSSNGAGSSNRAGVVLGESWSESQGVSGSLLSMVPWLEL